MKISFKCIFAIAVQLFITCGNVTQTGNPSGISAQFFLQDGYTPAKHITVNVYKRSQFADTASTAACKSIAISFVTDESGSFTDHSIDTGLYVVEAVSGDSLKARVDSVLIGNELVSIRDTLQTTGSITGSVYLSEGGDARKVFILLYGSDVTATPDSTGKFFIGNLAQGSYDLRFVSSLDNYSVLEKRNVKVVAGNVTLIDSINLPFSGIPSVKNLSVSYDSLEQVSTIRWKLSDTAVVKGYIVYRRLSGSNTLPQEIATLTVDTIYRDSTAVPGEVYEYNVVAIDKSGNRGLFDNGVIAQTVNLFEKITVYKGDSTFNEISDIVMLPNHRIAVIDAIGNQVQIIDSVGKMVRKWGREGRGDGEFLNPIAGAADDSGYMYILELMGNGRIQKFDTSGNFMGTMNVGPYCADLDYHNGKLFVTQNGPKDILKYGMFNSEFTQISTASEVLPMRACITDMNFFLTDGTTSTINSYSFGGLKNDAWGSFGVGQGQFMGIEEIAISPEGYLFVVDQLNGRIQVFSKEHSFVMSLTFVTMISGSEEIDADARPRSIAFDKEGRVYVADAVSIYKYKVSLPSHK